MRGRRLFAELLGTTILALGICLSEGDPYAAGASLWAGIIGTGFVSGASFNPAITTAVILVGIAKGKLSKTEFLEHLVYYVCHFVGAFLGSMLSWAIRKSTFRLAPPSDDGPAILAEACATGVLVLVALIGGELKDSNFIGTLAVSVALFEGIYTVGAISGGCLNPAIGVGANAADTLNMGVYRVRNIWIYILGPLCGSLIATVSYLIIKPELDFIYAEKEKQELQYKEFI